MTDFLKIAKSIAVHFAHICAYGVETVKHLGNKQRFTSVPLQALECNFSHFLQLC